jgi:hypothetical protein
MPEPRLDEDGEPRATGPTGRGRFRDVLVPRPGSCSAAFAAHRGSPPSPAAAAPLGGVTVPLHSSPSHGSRRRAAALAVHRERSASDEPASLRFPSRRREIFFRGIPVRIGEAQLCSTKTMSRGHSEDRSLALTRCQFHARSSVGIGQRSGLLPRGAVMGWPRRGAADSSLWFKVVSTFR